MLEHFLEYVILWLSKYGKKALSQVSVNSSIGRFIELNAIKLKSVICD